MSDTEEKQIDEKEGWKSRWKDGPRNKKGGGESKSAEARLKQVRFNDDMDRKYGFDRYEDPVKKSGWLLNMHASEILNEDKRLIAAVDFYFLLEDGGRFKVSLPFRPYFYVAAREGCDKEVLSYLSKKYADTVSSVEPVRKEDLDLANHLRGLKRTYLKLSFPTTSDLMKVRRELMPKIRKNQTRERNKSEYTDLLASTMGGNSSKQNLTETRRLTDQLENIIDIREYDVPYHVRVSIDLKIFVGHWYDIVGHKHAAPEITLNTLLVDRPDPIVLAFDIETTKLPLKFPDSASDQIMMISYMIDGQGYLIVNREIVAGDVEDFEYTPKPEYYGPFCIFNEADERNTLLRFLNHVLEVKPHIFVTYNGDSFDWPFIDARCAVHELNLTNEIGFEKDNQDEYKSRQAIHMDAYRWVKRDSYLPVGSQNLKATTRAKLRYDPVELDPEDMCRMACEQPQVLANYSVSDAVATYYLYMKYVHPFIFALCTIIPMEPDEVLRKGSGTLCEALLMVEAFHANIIFPNKQEQEHRKLTDEGRLLESETYVGGRVEALESGVFRANIPCRFRLVPSAFRKLNENVEHTLRHALEVEEGVPLDTVTNFQEECNRIKAKLQELEDTPSRLENPIIYHLDVGAMYPNIILTNRLQPPAIIEEIPASRSEVARILQQLENEKFPGETKEDPPRAFYQLSKEEQANQEKKRLKEYCRKAYRKQHETRLEMRETLICQRENSFYVDTVRAFRDRRYEYKGLLKNAKKKLAEALDEGGDPDKVKSWKGREVLYDSLQLAHKCILNSFYGYVMRKGSRWFSMEMAGIVCYTGACIIKQARELIEQIGRPLELDTDGIWCILPASFPENYTFKTNNPKKPKVTVSYPGAMLNVMVKETYTNDQYHELTDPEALKYEVRSENSIFFEVDGPYLAMVLPAAKEEGKKLKKRYAVFNFDGSLAELKGFEVKRRGELELIKIFQSSVFEAFLLGEKLDACYAEVAKVADHWLDVLFTKGQELPDNELFDLISENRSMSRKLEDYGTQKSTSISTAKRLAQFLGDNMVKDAGLACKYIIAKEPLGAPVTERAIPYALFQAEEAIQRHYLRKWLKNSNPSLDIRDILDWEYYVQRLGGCIQKIITIPAALQGVSNPVPRVVHPDWLHRRMLERSDSTRQRKITDMFAKAPPPAAPESVQSSNPSAAPTTEIEDLNCSTATAGRSKKNVTFCDDEDGEGPPQVKIQIRGSKRGLLKSGGKDNKDVSAVVDGGEYRSWRDVLGPPPPMGTTHADQLKWLEFHKRKWKFQITQRKNQRRQADDGTSMTGKRRRKDGGSANVGMRTFMNASDRALTNLTWQIIQIVEEPVDPGVFLLWVLVGDELHQIRLTVPRQFYINQKVPKASEQGDCYRRVNRILPRSNPVEYLYEYRVPEDKFQEQINNLQTDLNSAHIEGIYETKVTLLFRLLLNVGCLCKAKSPNRGRKNQPTQNSSGDSTNFHLDDLQFRSCTEAEYLGRKSIRHLYFYHYQEGVRGVFALLIPAQKRGLIWLHQERALPNGTAVHMDRLFGEERRNKLDRDPSVTVPKPDHGFDVRPFTSKKDVFKDIQKVLREYSSQKHGPTFIAVQSPLTSPDLYNRIPQMRQFPVVRIHMSDGNRLFAEKKFNWELEGCRRMVQHYMNSYIYLESYVGVARYLHIPLGNVPSDSAAVGADLLYGRALLNGNMVLWADEGERPDLGGKEMDDARLGAAVSDDSDPIAGSASLINETGLYSSVCVRLDIAALPVSAILQSNTITDREGGSSSIGFDQGPSMTLEEMVSGAGTSVARKMLTSYDESVLCAQAFRVLKHMVFQWVKEIAEQKNEYADDQAVHFYRWIQTSSSLMYDPALKRTLQQLMKKLTLLLVAELTSLGAVVVHATFTQIIICTKKQTVPDALNWVEYILKGMQSKELFGTLEIGIGKCMNVLLWMDYANFACVSEPPPTPSSSQQQLDSLSSQQQESSGGGSKTRRKKIIDSDDDEDDEDLDDDVENVNPDDKEMEDDNDGKDSNLPAVEMNWNLSKFLPETTLGCQSNFHQTVGAYVLLVYRYVRDNCARANAHNDTITPLGEEEQAESIKESKRKDGISYKLSQHCQELIMNETTQRMFTTVQSIHHKWSVSGSDLMHGDTSDPLFPRLPGSHLSLHNPALEFAKAVTQVLTLDEGIHEQVEKMRRDLLKLLSVPEFSPEAEWKDPCLPYVLPQVICTGCNHFRDIDLCRDRSAASVKTGSVQDNINNGPRRFLRCLQCAMPYPPAMIQQTLLRHLNQLNMAFTLQDLRCPKCKSIKEGHGNEYCECSGEYELTIPLQRFIQQLRTFESLALHYGLETLDESVKWLLLGNQL